jgi:hypothetical protein
MVAFAITVKIVGVKAFALIKSSTCNAATAVRNLFVHHTEFAKIYALSARETRCANMGSFATIVTRVAANDAAKLRAAKPESRARVTTKVTV